MIIQEYRWVKCYSVMLFRCILLYIISLVYSIVYSVLRTQLYTESCILSFILSYVLLSCMPSLYSCATAQLYSPPNFHSSQHFQSIFDNEVHQCEFRSMNLGMVQLPSRIAGLEPFVTTGSKGAGMGEAGGASAPQFESTVAGTSPAPQFS